MVDLTGAPLSDWWGNYRVLKTNMDPNVGRSVNLLKNGGGSFGHGWEVNLQMVSEMREKTLA